MTGKPGIKIINKETLIKLYEDHKNLSKIAKNLNINIKTLNRWFNFYQIPFAHNCRKNFFNEIFFDINNPTSIYWIGFIAADGNINKEKSRLKISLALKDIEHLKKFIKDINSNKEPKISSSLKKLKPHLPEKLYSQCTIRLNSVSMIKDLEKFNIMPNKGNYYSIPEIIKDYEYSDLYFRGYVDGDGCWCICRNKNKKDQLTFKLIGTKEFLTEFNKILVKKANLPEKSLNKKLSQIDKNGFIYKIMYNGTPICTKIAQWLYGRSNFPYLDRKYDLIKHLLI